MASSVGYTVVDAEVETRSTRSPDETALDEDAMEERPLPELPLRQWWSRVEFPSQFFARNETSRQHPTGRLALPRAKNPPRNIF